MKTMKALVKRSYEYDDMDILDYPVPEIGDSDVLLQVKAASICGSDLKLFHGGKKEEMTGVNFPCIIGHEFAGVIAAVGKNVKDWSVGDRVVSENTGHVCGTCYACSRGNFLQCPERLGMGYGMDGGFTNYVKISGDVLAIHPHALFKIPDTVSYEEASLLDPACNAYQALIQQSNFRPGENLVIFGAGAIGLFAVQMGRIIGANKIVVVGMSNDKQVRMPLAQKLGATDIVIGNEEDALARIAEICAPDGVTVALECAGANLALYQAIKCVQNGGTVVRIGQNPKPIDFSMNVLVDKAANLQGHMGYDTVSWKNCINLLKKGALDMKSMISHRFPLSEWRTGIELMLKQESIKVVLYPEGEGPDTQS